MASRWNAQQDAVNRLFRRCVECPQNVRPSCPNCDSDETCVLRPATCDSCPVAECLSIKGIAGQQQAPTPTPIGGIVGGVVGGVLALVVITFLIWRFCIRPKKRRDLWVPPEKNTVGRSGTMASRTHSIASTVMTRASNVIQIAYIPGVTVRSTPHSPEIAPPMPSIPSTHAGASAHTSPDVEQHFFMPKDLRDSVWSDTSSMMTDPRISIAPSLARASVATTIYQENAVVPQIPAQYAYRAQANAVSVRSGSSTPSIGANPGSTPPVPSVPTMVNMNNSSIVARNVVARPIEVKKSSATSLTVLHKKAPSRRTTPVPAISDEKEVVFSSPSSTVTRTSPMPAASMPHSSFSGSDGTSISNMPAVVPAAGALSDTSPVGRPTTAYTQAMIHEAMLRATQDSSHSGPSTASPRPDLQRHDSSPFSDSNEIR